MTGPPLADGSWPRSIAATPIGSDCSRAAPIDRIWRSSWRARSPRPDNRDGTRRSNLVDVSHGDTHDAGAGNPPTRDFVHRARTSSCLSSGSRSPTWRRLADFFAALAFNNHASADRNCFVTLVSGLAEPPRHQRLREPRGILVPVLRVVHLGALRAHRQHLEAARVRANARSAVNRSGLRRGSFLALNPTRVLLEPRLEQTITRSSRCRA